jgi:hypothetical protein
MPIRGGNLVGTYGFSPRPRVGRVSKNNRHVGPNRVYFKLVAFDIVVDEADRRTCLRALQSVRSRDRQEKVRLVHRDVPITWKHFLARLLTGESKAPET